MIPAPLFLSAPCPLLQSEKWPLPLCAMLVDETLLQIQTSGSIYVKLDNLDVKQSSREFSVQNSFRGSTQKVRLLVEQGISFLRL